MKNELGVLIGYNPNTDLVAKFKEAQASGFTTCQLCMWSPPMFKDDKCAENVKNAIAETGFKVTAIWAGWSGPCEWNFTMGPSTIGIVPPAYRLERCKVLMDASDFALKVGVNRIITHAGFIPEDPADPNFAGTVSALRWLCKNMKSKGQYFLFETGQETPVTMLRTIQAIGTDNIGINFDTANLILYGKANSVDALDVFGKYVMETHIKDGMYPTDGMELGHEVPVGQGKANIPGVVKKLKELGFQGSFTIEREISGEKQKRDIEMARDLLIKCMEEE